MKQKNQYLIFLISDLAFENISILFAQNVLLSKISYFLTRDLYLYIYIYILIDQCISLLFFQPIWDSKIIRKSLNFSYHGLDLTKVFKIITLLPYGLSVVLLLVFSPLCCILYVCQFFTVCMTNKNHNINGTILIIQFMQTFSSDYGYYVYKKLSNILKRKITFRLFYITWIFVNTKGYT